MSSQVIGIVKAARYLCRSAHGALEETFLMREVSLGPQGGENMFSALQAQSQEAPVVLGKDVTVLACCSPMKASPFSGCATPFSRLVCKSVLISKKPQQCSVSFP